MKNSKLAVIYDIHSNREALLAVGVDIERQGIKEIICGGDIIGYGPSVKECLEIVRNMTDKIVIGNHEFHVLNLKLARNCLNPFAFWGVEFAEKKLSTDDFEFIRALPFKLVMEDWGVTLVHSSPSNPNAFKYIFKEEEAQPEIEFFSTKICFVGHTHMSYVYDNKNGLYEGRMEDKIELDDESKYLINVGSVGQPRDGDPRASYGILECVAGKYFFNLRKVPYDIQKAQEAFEKTKLPGWSAERLFFGT